MDAIQDTITKIMTDPDVPQSLIVQSSMMSDLCGAVAGIKYFDFFSDEETYWQRVESGFYDRLETAQ